MKKQLLFRSIKIGMILIAASTGVKAQVTTPSNAGINTDYVGWNAAQPFPLQIRHNANQPITFHTNGTERMTILGNGNVGKGVTNPDAALRIKGVGQINTIGAGWTRAIHIENHGALIFDKGNLGAQNHFFMGHPSFSSQGHYLGGLIPNLGGSDAVNYVFQVYGQSNPNHPTEGDFRLFHNGLVDGRLGVGLLFPQEKVDVDGNARLRNTANGAGNYLMTGIQQGANQNHVCAKLKPGLSV
jgi:hypothetical protein